MIIRKKLNYLTASRKLTYTHIWCFNFSMSHATPSSTHFSNLPRENFPTIFRQFSNGISWKWVFRVRRKIFLHCLSSLKRKTLITRWVTFLPNSREKCTKLAQIEWKGNPSPGGMVYSQINDLAAMSKWWDVKKLEICKINTEESDIFLLHRARKSSRWEHHAVGEHFKQQFSEQRQWTGVVWWVNNSKQVPQVT